MKVWAGIDPGNDGALAIISEDGRVNFRDAPTAKVQSGKKTRTVLLPQEMARWLGEIKGLSTTGEDLIGEFGGQELYHSALRVYVEKVTAMRGQGVTSMFNFGMGYGMWLGVLAALSIPYELVTPQRWKKEMLAGMGKKKDASVVKAIQLFPEYADQLQRPKRGGGVVRLHGRGDALLLAEMNRRQG